MNVLLSLTTDQQIGLWVAIVATLALFVPLILDYLHRDKKTQAKTEAQIIIKKPSPRLTPYKIFIASPDGLDDERKVFYDEIKYTNSTHAKDRGIIFEGLGWEVIPPEYGISQDVINRYLYQCDFYVLILWDRWGSVPYPDGRRNLTSGSEAEYYEAVRCKEDKYPMKDIAIFFKNNIEPRRLKKPGKQLQRVLDFKSNIIKERKPYFKEFTTPQQFQRELSIRFAEWARKFGKQLIKPERTESNVLSFDDPTSDKKIRIEVVIDE